MGKEIVCYLNFSSVIQKVKHIGNKGMELLTKEQILKGGFFDIEPWNLKAVESKLMLCYV